MCKYSKWYDQIITRSKERSITGYVEKHHIIPKSLGGSDRAENIAILTAREHFVCHLLLVKMKSGDEKFKMLCAIQRFAYKGKYKSRVYSSMKEQLMKERSKRMSGENNPNFGGKLQTDEVKAKMRKPRANPSNMGKWERTAESIDTFRASRIGKGCGESNAMADPEKRAKVAASKLGKKKFKKDGAAKMFTPGTEPDGWVACKP